MFHLERLLIINGLYIFGITHTKPGFSTYQTRQKIHLQATDTQYIHATDGQKNISGCKKTHFALNHVIGH
jgi:hypothetical protein